MLGVIYSNPDYLFSEQLPRLQRSENVIASDICSSLSAFGKSVITSAVITQRLYDEPKAKSFYRKAVQSCRVFSLRIFRYQSDYHDV